MYHTALNSIALHCAALSDVLYSTAQYSAAQHGTAPHSTVQYSSDVLLGKRFRCTYVQVHRLEYSFHLVSPSQFLVLVLLSCFIPPSYFRLRHFRLRLDKRHVCVRIGSTFYGISRREPVDNKPQQFKRVESRAEQPRRRPFIIVNQWYSALLSFANFYLLLHNPKIST